MKHNLTRKYVLNITLIWFSKRWSALEARCMRPVGVDASERVGLSRVLSLVVRGRGRARRAVFVMPGNTWAPPESVWQLTCAPAYTTDSCISQVTSMQITTAFGEWIHLNLQKMHRKDVWLFCVIVIDIYTIWPCSHCENGAMRCSSTEMTSFLSDLFYDDAVPSRGIILNFICFCSLYSYISLLVNMFFDFTLLFFLIMQTMCRPIHLGIIKSKQ